ncbi:MAG TPA: hypothetical protein VN840_21200 [Streptosporangiaceae bacterium]|nr:hypothetical protein [Streptosporangiaceae bacterium]
MPFCTIVEFEWTETFDRGRFAGFLERSGHGDSLPDGCLTRIGGIDDHGARMIEVWRSSEDARRFAEQSAPSLAGAQMPAPSRVLAFETSTYLTT